MKLESSELEALKEYQDLYRTIHSEIGELEEDLSKLKKKKEVLLDKLNKTRFKESEFSQVLVAKYGGSFELDFDTGEIKMTS